MMTRILAISIVLAVLLSGGCYSRKGGLMPMTGGAETYWSTSSSPKTVTLVDVRTEDILWQVDIPVGKQLTYKFEKGKGDDPVKTPNLLRWQLFDIGTGTGSLRNSLTVPHQRDLRFDVMVRPIPEFAEADPGQQALRTDQMIDRPAWWTPVGGPMPKDPHGVTNYDR